MTTDSVEYVVKEFPVPELEDIDVTKVKTKDSAGVDTVVVHKT